MGAFLRWLACTQNVDVHLQEKRQQIMNDIRGLCDVSHPALVQFIGAFRVPDSGQVSLRELV